MKHKKFKIEGTTLFVYRPQAAVNSSNGHGQVETAVTDPVTVTSGTITHTGVFKN